MDKKQRLIHIQTMTVTAAPLSLNWIVQGFFVMVELDQLDIFPLIYLVIVHDTQLILK